MSDVSYTQNKIVIGGTEHGLASDIKDVVDVGDRVVVLVVSETRTGGKDHNNIKCLSKNGNQIWEIETPDREPTNGTSIYMDMVFEDEELFAYHRNTHKYKVNLNDGSIEELGKSGK